GHLVAQALGASSRIAFPRQVHGTAVVVLDDMPAGPIGDADALVTAMPGLAVGVLGADCPGVLVVDPVRRALAVAPAGGRGTVAGVLTAAIRTLTTRYGSQPGDLRVGLGPGISARRYEVGPDVADAVRASSPHASDALTQGRGDRSFLDLHA